ncbi:MAG TPA: hypothetical protein VK654_04625 [Nitrospirota bacterium]|nr:hypothetical protein [Nitrospirota bacterium]
MAASLYAAAVSCFFRKKMAERTEDDILRQPGLRPIPRDGLALSGFNYIKSDESKIVNFMDMQLATSMEFRKMPNGYDYSQLLYRAGRDVNLRILLTE